MTDRDELKRRLSSSSAKILLMGDLHLMDKAPRNATESYTDDILEILDFTAKLEKTLQLDAVVWAGDIFHHKQPGRTSHKLVLKAIEAANKYRRLYIVTGNHDITNDRLDSLNQQPLGVLLEGSNALELDGWASGLPVAGIPWQQDWMKEGAVERAVERLRRVPGEDFTGRLVVTHAPIYPPATADEQNWEVLPAFEFAKAMDGTGSVYYGHIHEDHGIYEVSGTTFCNVGAISRGSLTEYNLQRGVKAALWTPEHGFLEIDLPHKPAEEVFHLAEASMVKDKKISDERFLTEVGSTRIEISSTAGVISHIEQLDEIEPAVKKTAIELLELQDA